MPRDIKKIEGVRGFTLNISRLEQVVKRVDSALQQNQGIFRHGLKPYLPQWNLPPELEYNPQQTTPKDPKKASQFLWVRLFCDRLSSSSHLIKTARQAWNNPEVNWIYDPQQVIVHTPEEVKNVLQKTFKFAVTRDKEEDNGARFYSNARTLVEKYDADSRNLIVYKTVEESRQHMMKLKGIGTGLANLFMMELCDREIVKPIDCENMLFKIDRHKAGIAIYTAAIEPKNNEIDTSTAVPPLEEAYRDICQRNNLNTRHTDAAIWVIGSQICSRQDYRACVAQCPLAQDLCISRTALDPQTGRYVVMTVNGKRVETRKNTHQGQLFYIDAKPEEA